MKKKFKIIDLFAGVGGIRKGFEETGKCESVYANDFDKDCKVTYDFNSSKVKLTVADINDIKTKNIPDFDILLGGFPCQAFSIAGYRKGFNDEKGRGNLFLQIERIIKEKKTKPLAFMLENVKNLENHDHGNTFKVIKETLKSLGYNVDQRVLNTMEYGGIPQNRERIYIVGFLNKKHLKKFKWPEKIKLKKTIIDMLDDNVNEKYYYEGKPLYERIKDYPFRIGVVYQWRRKYIRENKKNVCPTLTANMGMGGHNVPIIKDKKGIRKMTPTECARFQGLNGDFKLPNNLADSKLYKQIGNSVSVPVVKRVAENMIKALEKN